MDVTLKYRSRIIIDAYSGWILGSDKVIDIGCGNGVVSEELKKYFKCDIMGVDILDYRRRNIDFKLLDKSGKLPFKDKEFSIGMFNDALHHCGNWETLLCEALRVSEKVLIFEMEPTGIAKALDFIVNMIHNPKMGCAFNLKRIEEWKDYFQKHNLELECRRLKKPSFIYPFKHFSFCIRTRSH